MRALPTGPRKPATAAPSSRPKPVLTLVQPAKSQPPPPRPSAPGTPELTYQWERFPAIARELPPLFKRHYREIGAFTEQLAPDPNWDRFYELDLVGALRVLTVRTGGRALVGYVFVCLYFHPNHATIPAAQYDRFWLDPTQRLGRAGVKLFAEVERELDGLKIKLRYVNESLRATGGRLGKLLKRFGYAPSEVVYTKYVGD